MCGTSVKEVRTLAAHGTMGKAFGASMRLASRISVTRRPESAAPFLT